MLLVCQLGACASDEANGNGIEKQDKLADTAPAVWRAVSQSFPAELLAGQLKIELKGNQVKGEIQQAQATAQLNNKKRFELEFKPVGNKPGGAFVGHFVRSEDGAEPAIYGHWVQPNLKLSDSVPYATPVHFSYQNGTYMGDVKPLKDELNIYFIGQPISHERFTLSVFIPQTNAGRFYLNTELQLSGASAKILRRTESGIDNLENGYFNALTNTFRFNFPYWGGMLTFTPMEHPPSWLLKNNQQQAYQIPNQQNDGWVIGHANDFGMDSQVLQDFANQLHQSPATAANQAQIEAMLIARKGTLVFEDYFRGYGPDSPHGLRSASKSLTGLLPGLLVQQDHLAAAQTFAGVSILQMPVYKTLNYAVDDAQKRDITLEHVLSMRTGLDCDDNSAQSKGSEDTVQNQQQDWVNYTLDLKQLHAPGSHIAYCSAGINLAGPIMSALTGEWVPSIIEQYFAKPLDIHHYHVNLMPGGEQAYSGGGLRLRARDFLKMGQLLLNKGKWQGKQLISEQYINALLQPYGAMFGDQYGLGWWIRDYSLKNGNFRAYYAGGNGGQQVIVVPELDLVAVFLGSAYSTRGTIRARDDYFPNVVLANAVLE